MSLDQITSLLSLQPNHSQLGDGLSQQTPLVITGKRHRSETDTFHKTKVGKAFARMEAREQELDRRHRMDVARSNAMKEDLYQNNKEHDYRLVFNKPPNVTYAPLLQEKMGSMIGSVHLVSRRLSQPPGIESRLSSGRMEPVGQRSVSSYSVWPDLIMGVVVGQGVMMPCSAVTELGAPVFLSTGFLVGVVVAPQLGELELVPIAEVLEKMGKSNYKSYLERETDMMMALESCEQMLVEFSPITWKTPERGMWIIILWKSLPRLQSM
ncbi:hypothetical protein SELMODRAFT_424230 [Selaginella moellendorffii]|uniref:Uncharacterized protein n=1 Tax=Selaginella moellendorffii TaxID=88036 RepID=D8SP79_SELML|nr:hypothetical protein SELMODRAFT_424230 [Selaginella moellendorffii]